MPAVFIAQSTLQQWADAGKVRLEDTTLFLLKEQRSVVLKPAVRFTKLTVGDADPHALLGKVKTADQLRSMDAEHYMDSVICGDFAYEVVEGFLGDLQAAQPIKAAAKPSAAAASVAEAPVLSTDIPRPGAPAPPRPSPAKAVPAPVLVDDTPPLSSTEGEPEELSDAEALSKLFLDTVR